MNVERYACIGVCAFIDAYIQKSINFDILQAFFFFEFVINRLDTCVLSAIKIEFSVRDPLNQYRKRMLLVTIKNNNIKQVETVYISR